MVRKDVLRKSKAGGTKAHAVKMAPGSSRRLVEQGPLAGETSWKLYKPQDVEGGGVTAVPIVARTGNTEVREQQKRNGPESTL